MNWLRPLLPLLTTLLCLRLVIPPSNLLPTDLAHALETDVAALAVAPHPLGTPEHDRVRDVVAQSLRDAGFSVEIQTSSVVPRSGKSWTVQNVVAVLPGRRPDALLFASHYDSAPRAPGASDDAGGVATVLAAARALSGRTHENTVIVLVTDGEEAGLLGARTFVETPLYKTVVAVLNFEARGSGGPSVMFQAGPGSGLLLDVFSQSPAPLASSLAAAVYEVLPNDTDFTILAADRPGLNFAWFDRMIDYHAPTDDLAHLDRRSLEQHAASALTLTTLADADLSHRSEPGVYLPTPLGLLRYSRRIAQFLALLTALCWMVARLRTQTRLGKPLWAGLLLGACSLMGLATMGIVGKVATFLDWTGNGFDSPHRIVFRTVFLLTGTAVSMTLARRIPDGRLGAALLAALVAVPWGLLSPETSYLVGLPALVLCLGAVVEPRMPATALLSPLALVAVVPFTALLFAALPLSWGPLAAFPTVVLAALLTPSCLSDNRAPQERIGTG